MKKIMLIIGFLLLAVMVNAQVSFFKPVPKDVFKATAISNGVTATPTHLWLLRPTVSLTAVQLTWNKETKTFDSNAFSSTGLGVGYQHYVDVNGVPFNNYGFNALLLFIANDGGEASMAGVLTITALKFVSVGAGYNFGLKTPLILTGVSYNF
jgi:hypothetical protein